MVPIEPPWARREPRPRQDPRTEAGGGSHSTPEVPVAELRPTQKNASPTSLAGVNPALTDKDRGRGNRGCRGWGEGRRRRET